MKGTLLFLTFAIFSNVIAQTPLDWVNKFSPDFAMSVSDIKPDGLGNVYAIGTYSGTVDFDFSEDEFFLTGEGFTDIFILKLESDGSFIWAKSIAGLEYESIADIVIDNDGNLLMTGYYGDGGTAYQVDFDPGPNVFYLNGGNSNNIYVLKLNSNGEFIWAKSMTSRQGEHSENEASGYSITIDSDNNVYTTGNFTQITDFDPSEEVFELVALNYTDIFIQKLTPNGDFVWAKSFGGDEDFNLQYGKNVYVFNNQIYVIGVFSGTIDFDPGSGISNLTSDSGSDVFILKLDTDANFLWAKNYGGSGTVVARNSTIDESGNFYITGYFNNTIDFDPGPNAFNLSAIQFDEMYIQKLNNEGEFVWVKAIYGSQYETASDIMLDSSGSIYTVGGFEGTVDFDPSQEEYNLTSIGCNDIFIHKLNQNGDFVGVSTMGSTGCDYVVSATIDDSGALYFVGNFQETVDFDPGFDVFNLTAYNSVAGDPYVLKLNDNFLAVNTIGGLIDDSIILSPNPAIDNLEIKTLNETLLIKEYIIYDISGKIVLAEMYHKNTIDISTLKTGIYFVKIISNTAVSTKKVVKI